MLSKATEPTTVRAIRRKPSVASSRPAREPASREATSISNVSVHGYLATLLLARVPGGAAAGLAQPRARGRGRGGGALSAAARICGGGPPPAGSPRSGCCRQGLLPTGRRLCGVLSRALG